MNEKTKYRKTNFHCSLFITETVALEIIAIKKE